MIVRKKKERKSFLFLLPGRTVRSVKFSPFSKNKRKKGKRIFIDKKRIPWYSMEDNQIPFHEIYSEVDQALYHVKNNGKSGIHLIQFPNEKK